MSDHYTLLGVERDADAATIRAAYRRAMQIAHPDVAGGSEEDARALNQAFAILSDSARRAAYDRDLSTEVVTMGSSAVRNDLAVRGRSEPLPISWIVVLAIIVNAILIMGIATGGQF